ncbi:hypothetical protein NLU13_2323 [Sarocladium strictum]|uniref:PHD and RING finger domain-containing protein n=1 Tax=Sarocladium strictum TaxID=5046 RepID=A0AA39GUK1_SARSR|nr:hypothetical protein NLU13_2323 [Sarocladium strictum]
MSEPDQCIICLDSLPRLSDAVSDVVNGETKERDPDAATTTTATVLDNDSSYLNIVAALDGCDHVIHDACIRSWAQKTNTCPICRNLFHSVRVYNGLDGTVISTYKVEDKKQVADFDAQQWLGENPEEDEEEGNPCPICNSAEREDVLLLCDSCDAAYHTHCIGLEEIPAGDWYCLECAHLFQLTDEPRGPDAATSNAPRPRQVRRPAARAARGDHVRTRARQRRARRQARNAEWQGAWGQFSGRFYEMSELDLDNFDDEDEDLEQFRRFQQLDRRELQRWQQRMNIAQRLGARESFVSNIPPQISERLQPAAPPSPPRETEEERRAWIAFERARDLEENGGQSSASSRKRKNRSVTASPAEPVQEPERKLKRPRTRRIPTQSEGSTSVPSPAPVAGSSVGTHVTNGAVPASGSHSSPIRNGVSSRPISDEPPLVSSLLKELEPHGGSDDESLTITAGWRPPVGASSPVLSPTTSAHSSPRALSLTPPPFPTGRPTSPTLSLSTHIEPNYPPANYSPSRSHSDSESRPSRHEGRSLELRQPRPRRPRPRPRPQAVPRAINRSPPQATITQDDKKNINEFVRTALRPHWHAQKLTTEQYATINRDISRKLYDEVKDAASLDEESRRLWEKRATQEVAQAVSELQA